MTCFDTPSRPPRLAVLLSGGGRTLANLIATVERGELRAECVAVVSSNPAARGVAIAAAAGIPVAIIRRTDFADDETFSEAIYAAVRPHRPDLLICGGFLKRLVVPPEWAGRILNIHPALIPESGAAGRGFYGGRVHEAVLASGATESGATVHIVDNEYDHGPVVLKATVPVVPGDTAESLAARVFATECELYPRAILAHWRALTGTLDAQLRTEN